MDSLGPNREDGVTVTAMTALQPDLFGFPQHSGPVRDAPSPEIIALVRTRLHAALALVQGAERMPWPDQLSVIREDNAFRYAKGLLPAEEGAALWAAFDREMDRPYAVMNEGKDVDMGK
jgi:hypothetical protein